MTQSRGLALAILAISARSLLLACSSSNGAPLAAGGSSGTGGAGGATAADASVGGNSGSSNLGTGGSSGCTLLNLASGQTGPRGTTLMYTQSNTLAARR